MRCSSNPGGGSVQCFSSFSVGFDALVRHFPGEQEVERAAERVDVGADVHGHRVARLLRREEVRRADHEPFLRDAAGFARGRSFSMSRASPRSTSFTTLPSRDTRMFDGLMSR